MQNMREKLDLQCKLQYRLKMTIRNPTQSKLWKTNTHQKQLKGKQNFKIKTTEVKS